MNKKAQPLNRFDDYRPWKYPSDTTDYDFPPDELLKKAIAFLKQNKGKVVVTWSGKAGTVIRLAYEPKYKVCVRFGCTQTSEGYLLIDERCYFIDELTVI